MIFFVFIMLATEGQRLYFPAQTDIYLEAFNIDESTAPVVFFAPHENEAVVRSYLAEQVQKQGARFLVLHQGGERNIALNLDGQLVYVDPNRIFTQEGARSSLLRENPGFKPTSPLFFSALNRALALGRFILGQFGALPPQAVIVAIHNNTNGYDDDGKAGIGTISMKRYEKKRAAGAKYIGDLKRHWFRDEDDLYFLTDRSDFTALKRFWNVILQAPEVATLQDEDDGSLSIWAEMAGLRYFNIEAQRRDDNGVGQDHLRAQKKMVDRLFKLLKPVLKPAPAR